MKKILFLSMCMLCMLVSCSSDDDSNSKIVGLWEETSVTLTVTSIENGELLECMERERDYTIQYKFNENNTYDTWYRGSHQSGTYTVIDDVLHLSDEHGNYHYTIQFKSETEMHMYSEPQYHSGYLNTNDSVFYDIDIMTVEYRTCKKIY